MGWNIRVWHEEQGENIRLMIEAGSEVPEEVISAVAGAYWLDEVQYVQGEWDEVPMEQPPGEGGPRMHG